MLIKELNNTKIEGRYDVKGLIVKMAKETARSGKEYASLQISDSTGEFKTKYWEIDIFEKVKVGDIIAANIEAKTFNNAMGFVIKEFTLLQGENPAEYKNSFIPAEAEMVSFLRGKIAEIYKARPDLKVVLDNLANIMGFDKFFKWAAACGMHHAGENGLLYHTTSMIKHAEALIESTKATYDIEADRYLINTAIILHDFFKIKEYSMNDAGRGEVTKFSLLGHIQMASQFVGYLYFKGLIDEELYLQLSHAVSAHHGELEFGSPVVPATVEAYIVHTADLFDSRMYMFKDELRKLEVGEMAANKHFGLGSNVYNPIPKY